MNSACRIVGISDVSVGYGSPQVPMLLESLCDFYGEEAIIFEPDERGGELIRSISQRWRIERIHLSMSPHSSAGRIEYIAKVAQRLNEIRPNLLVIFCTYSLPVLLKLRFRPAFIIYDSIESIEAYGSFDIRLNQILSDRINLIIFPEENRARLDIERCGFHDIPIAIVYNVANEPGMPGEIVPATERDRKLFYGGTIDRKKTLADYFLSEEMETIPVDLFGPIRGEDGDELSMSLVAAGSRVKYKGLIDSTQLGRLRKRYAFSIVMWAPTSENQLYAAPNKLFEAISDGVPPITAPHPQCRILVDRYGCGIVMNDWSLDAFHSAVRQALEVFGTSRYDEMIENCRTAVTHELNWGVQFDKVKRLLPKEL